MDRIRESCYGTVLPDVPVQPDDDFFVLGGDSIQLIRLVVHAQYEFDIEIAAAEFFTEPTLRRLTGIVRREIEAAERLDAELLDAVLAEVGAAGDGGGR